MIKIKIFLGVDHQGTKYKDEIVSYLEENGIDVSVVDIPNSDSDDYPDFAYAVCINVLNNNGLGILACGSGIGMSIAANKIKGIRCAKVDNSDEAFTAKNHNGANVISFSINLEKEEIFKIIDTFLATKEPTEERHLRRIEKVRQIENGTYKY